ncbi:MAG TPA: hypothetical protein ENN46_00500 [Candidatus Woesearchaeota archaeon]|nr:hypothetical protein [Candidatus Woesearchaeota archaeon]
MRIKPRTTFSENRKGFQYTLLAFLVVVGLISLSRIDIFSQTLDPLVVESRLLYMNNFVSDLESDIDNAVEIIGYRAVLGIIQNVVSSGIFIDNFSLRFNEAFLNGTIKNEPQAVLQDNSFSDFVLKIKAKADPEMISLNFSLRNVSVSQDSSTGPWFVRVNVTFHYSLYDKISKASFNRTVDTSSRVSIFGLEDPTFLLNSYGRVARSFRKSSFSYFADGNDVSNLLNHTTQGLYIESPSAPGFIERIEGRLVPSPYGLESLINLSDFIINEIPTYENSIVDYIYFLGIFPDSFRINGTPGWFRIDESHLDVYGVRHLALLP